MFISYISSIVACVEIAFALTKYSIESKRKRYSITIERCTALIDDLYRLRELYLSIDKSSNTDLFNPEIIKNNPTIPIRREIMRSLTSFEGLAEGMEHNVFDYKLYVTLIPDEIIKMYIFLQRFILDERNNLHYDLLFDKSEIFIEKSQRDFNKKLNGQHISKRYNQKGRR